MCTVQPTHDFPDRLFIGLNVESRKRVYSEAFGGEWTQSEYHEVDDNSDDGWDDTGWCTGIVVKTGYSWEWKFDDLIACEAEMQNEREHEEEQASRSFQEETEYMKYLISLAEDGTIDNKCSFCEGHLGSMHG